MPFKGSEEKLDTENKQKFLMSDIQLAINSCAKNIIKIKIISIIKNRSTHDKKHGSIAGLL